MPPVLERLCQVLAICLPVFACIGLGVFLRRRGVMNDDHQRFLTWFINDISLPALLFIGVARRDVQALFNLPVIIGTCGATLLMLGLGLAVASLLRLPPALRAPASHTGYWANATYLGIPLCISAFGEDRVAIIVSAFAMPLFVITGILVNQGFLQRGQVPLGRTLLKVLTNPIVMSAFGGLAVAAVIHTGPVSGFVHGPGVVAGLVAMLGRALGRLLDLVGAPGLPVALVCIGYALRWEVIRDHRGLLAWTVVAKNLIAPLVTLAIIRLAFPHAAASDLGGAVLMMATPTAVACFVISRAAGADGPFLAANLTLSTAFSCISIPVWLYLLLP